MPETIQIHCGRNVCSDGVIKCQTNSPLSWKLPFPYFCTNHQLPGHLINCLKAEASPASSLLRAPAMASIPCVPASSPLDASITDIACDQLVDLFWFYGAGASLLGVENAHQSITHVKDIRKPLEATHQISQHAAILGEQAHQRCKNINIAQQSPSPGSSPVNWLRRVFDTFDEDNDGLLSLEELRRSFEKLGLESSNVHCLLRNTRVPNDQVGAVSHDDFLLLYHGSSKQRVPHHSSNNDIADVVDGCKDYAEEDLIRDAFNVFDKDKDGFISPTELQSVLCNLGFGAAKELDACVEMIRGYDLDDLLAQTSKQILPRVFLFVICSIVDIEMANQILCLASQGKDLHYLVITTTTTW
ncbi:hypothetical protein GOP47_0014556 [Adiantum capillus-veneris]|uniref:EF-hand domain-containing protein n=1 Tax=Adiantum capillus-veneris TaxID=13818 RepID=A0A9D4ULQ1_ADICA|nr:hypothetical protein GOP47_0014556 [Adiantum capillus-veneris]